MNRLVLTPGLLLTILLVAHSFLFAQAPPRELQGRYMQGNNDVELRWQVPYYAAKPSAYHIYRHASDSAFSLLTTVTANIYNDHNISIGEVYTYQITDISGNNVESYPTNAVAISTGGSAPGDSTAAALRITTDPVAVSSIDQVYEYAVGVQTNPPGTAVCYTLRNAPAGMAIDATGLITWTPASAGMFEVEVQATLCGGGVDGHGGGHHGGGAEGEAEQSYQLMVIAGIPGSLSGTVTTDLPSAPASALLRLFDVSTGDFVLQTGADSLGHFSFPILSPSTYFLRIQSDADSIRSQWYNGVQDVANATPITIHAGDSLTLEIKLQKDFNAESLYTISGMVMDSASNPVAGARVTASKAGRLQSSDDNRYDDRGRHGRGGGQGNGGHNGGSGGNANSNSDQFSTTTDAFGNYRFSLHGGPYTVSAEAAGFRKQFFNNKATPLDADVLQLHHDTTGIDFSLLSRSSGTGSIGGIVRTNTDSAGVQSHVIGYQVDNAGHFTGFVTATESDTAGAYLLAGLPAGAYIVGTLGEHEDVIPAFYSAAGGTPFLDSATVINVNGNAVAGINIFVTPDSVEGLNDVSGEVESETGGLNKTTALSQPIGGTIITVTDNAHHPAGAAISNTDGSYRVSGLQPGAYTVTFQKPGQASVSTPISIAYANNTPTVAALSAALSPTGSSILGVGANGGPAVPHATALHQNYPNPFNPTTTISFDLPAASHVTLRVYNTLGQEIATLMQGEIVGAGSHNVRFDASRLSSGVYLYRIEAGSFSAAKRMVLVK